MIESKITPKLRSRVSAEVLQLSWDEKKRLYEAWQLSGLSRTEFCAQKKLALATFQGWINRFQSEQASSFCPISISEKVPFPAKSEAMLLEVVLPNAVIARVQATEAQFGFLLKELFYAATIIR